MSDGSLVDRLSLYVNSLQEDFEILSETGNLEDLAKQFAHIIRGSLLVKHVTVFHRNTATSDWRPLFSQASEQNDLRQDLGDVLHFHVETADSPPYDLTSYLPLRDGSVVALVIDEKLDGKNFSNFDKISLQLFLQLFDNAYQAIRTRQKEKDLIFSLKHSIVQLNSLIDTGIEITSLENQDSVFQLALQRGAALTNAAKSLLRITQDSKLQEEICFPSEFKLKQSDMKNGHLIEAGFDFAERYYNFYLLEKESRRGIVDFEDRDQLLLDAIARQVKAALENDFLVQQSLEKQRIEQDISVAAAIQQRIIPEQLPKVGGYDLAGINIPSKDVGGDYYDCIRLKDSRLVLVVADVSGKGVPASLLVSSLQASLFAYLESDFALPDLVGKLNRAINMASTPDKFITFFIGLLTPRTGQFEFISAGHNPVFLARQDGRLEKLHTGGIGLGIVGFDPPYKSSTLTIHKGEPLLLYTDGIPEAENEDEDFYEDDRLERFFVQHAGDGADEFIKRLVDDVRNFAGNAPQTDDITALFVKRVK
ncbi:PP2C family protein-serine/threonine phosphatase [bacterium]|nr:PP2C family protein-serine/threonine phosphatase [bacterium]